MWIKLDYFDSDNDLSFFSCRGGDLFNRIDDDSLPEFEAVKILKQVLEAVKYMHGLGFMHLDLKVGISLSFYPPIRFFLKQHPCSIRKSSAQPTAKLRNHPGSKSHSNKCQQPSHRIRALCYFTTNSSIPKLVQEALPRFCFH